MRLPDTLEPFRKEAKALLRDHQPEEIVFSGPTYQIRFTEDGESLWVFLQLDDQDQAKDLFCQGDACATAPTCRHMAAAYLTIFKDSSTPLHKRFESSAFFHLFYPIALAHPTSMQKRDSLLRLAHTIVVKSSQQWQTTLETILSAPPETEETSIKFSSLTHQELEDWKEGILSPRLRFELSPLSDVAKYLFQHDETHPCSFQFEETKKPPRYIRCSWEDLECRLPCSQDLTDLLNALPAKRTTPHLEPFGGKRIETISFSPKKQTATITLQDGHPFDLSKALVIGDWNYIPNVSFVKTVPDRISISDPHKLISFLENNLSCSQRLPVSYHIDVKQEGLLIKAFLNTPNDLQEAIFLDSWIWRKKEGFQHIEPLKIPSPSFLVRPEELTEFARTNHNLLASIPGFTFHERQAKEFITFSVEKSGALIFHSTALPEEGGRLTPIGDWVYVENEGFFLKSADDHFPFDMPIVPHRVSSFIRDEQERLRTIPNFFATKTPLTEISLQICAVTDRKIELKPRYKWTDKRFERLSRFYDDFGYVPDIGFFPLPELLTSPSLSKTILAKDRDEWDRFFLEVLPSLKHEYICEVDPHLEPPLDLKLVCQNLEGKDQEAIARTPQFWEAQFLWESSIGNISAEQVYKALKRSERFLITPAGLLDLTHERFGWLASVPHPNAGQQYHLKTVDFLKIRAHDEFSFDSEAPSSTTAIISRLLAATPTLPPTLSLFTGTLRPYQMRGVEWLWHLYLSGLSGLLCDDMGVGKTHQAMALLAAVKEYRSDRKTRFLVICPTSLLWHWAEKLAKTIPWIKIFTYVGAKRSLEELRPDHDLILTTYGLWRNDIKTLRHLSFDVAIFDELQIAKSHVSQIWSTLCQVKADMRLGLTGTPLENQLRELRAIFDLVLPGYVPPDLFMRDLSYDHRNLLSRYIRPFILRRRKQDVLPDLPAKTEDIYTTELIGDQKDLYRQIVARQGLPILHQLRDEHTPIPYMHIFALISALKQICNHPAAYLRDVENYQRYESGKWETFIELLSEAQESGQKVVVFSQFLSMLDIIGKHLKTHNISYAEIRGSTKERGAAIATFQNDPSCQVFLGSLQAAGLGIDLTAASIVIHYDRWWNAARENQATDRVHRIGQTRGVLVYKLMTANSIEERIDHIISHKSQLFEDVIRYDDHQIMKKLNRAELLDLFHNLESV